MRPPEAASSAFIPGRALQARGPLTAHTRTTPKQPTGARLSTGCLVWALQALAPPTTLDQSHQGGMGKWGHADLAGNVLEWTLDWFVAFAVPCVDCGYLGTTSEPVSTKVNRGGSFDSFATAPFQQGATLGQFRQGSLFGSDRNYTDPTVNLPLFGARCARTP
jgi:formylglycine-generating enzyme required for sulfatase activity